MSHMGQDPKLEGIKLVETWNADDNTCGCR